MNTPKTKDKLLFTPGPLTTSETVKAAMSRDIGSRDIEFIGVIREIRLRLLDLAGESDDSLYTAIPVQGSGTYGIEAVLSSVIGQNDKLLLIINGAYGKRMAQIAAVHRIAVTTLVYPENQRPALDEIDQVLQADLAITAVTVVHCETTTGIFNPIEAIGEIVKRRDKTYLVDAMSSFGAVPIPMRDWGIDYLISSSNKCIEGVPGFSFVLARKDNLTASEGNARTVSLDILSQWRELDKTAQFRYTPPTHVMLAFYQALLELDAEGGISGRAARYRQNNEILLTGMRELGFREYLSPDVQGYIITTFHDPDHPNFYFESFYQLLNERGFVIYPGKLGGLACFRLGNIGRLYPADMRALLDAIRDTLDEMSVTL